MAILSGSPIGLWRGKLGNMVGRIMDGRTILSMRPDSFHVNNSPEMVEIRKKFAVTLSFVSNMLKLSAIHEIWEKLKESRMTVYNYAFKKNYRLSSSDKPTVDNLLTPIDGFPITVTAAAVGETAVTGQIAALESVLITTPEDFTYNPNVLICFYNPVDPNDAPYQIVTAKGIPQLMDTINPITISVPLNVVQQNIAAKYENSTLYIALVTQNEAGKVIQYSATYAQDN